MEREFFAMEVFDLETKEENKRQDPLLDEYLGKPPAMFAIEKDELGFDYVPQGRKMVLVAVSLPDGGKLTRKTEPLSGRDGDSGFRVLKGYTLPDGQLLAKDIKRNSDGSISLLAVDPENRMPDKPEIRMTQADFVIYIKSLMKN